jgi:hypothetical protein
MLEDPNVMKSTLVQGMQQRVPEEISMMLLTSFPRNCVNKLDVVGILSVEVWRCREPQSG